MDFGYIIFVFIGLAILIRVLAGFMDGDRVSNYIRSQGGELLEKSWEPFGPGWWGEKDSRIYRVVYRDREGSIHEAHVKTSVFSGVYFTNDRIIQGPRRAAPVVESTEAEKARLCARLRDLERDGR